jgi:hypothetical protein
MRGTTIVAAMLVLGWNASAALAGPPSYLLLKRASAPDPIHPGEPSGTAYAAPVQGYAYGWFGACPRVHPERQMGSYRANIDWRFK